MLRYCGFYFFKDYLQVKNMSSLKYKPYSFYKFNNPNISDMSIYVNSDMLL